MEMDVYFDYGCPYCLQGFAYFEELANKYKHIAVNFIPVEAHPRPENHGLHTDLCAQAMYVARDMEINLWDFHAYMYKAAINDDVNIESAGVLSEVLGKYMNKKKVFEALQNNAYLKQVEENNHRAYDKEGVWAVPAFRMNGEKLDAKEGIGITFNQLNEFMSQTEMKK